MFFTKRYTTRLIFIFTSSQYHEMPGFIPTNYFLAMGTLMFAYGGHAAFPTFQVDMRRPSDFHFSSFFAFGGEYIDGES